MSDSTSCTGYLVDGSKNRFLLLDFLRNQPQHLSSHVIQKLCADVHVDGLLALSPSDKAALKMQYFNKDGNEASMCGNGLRCTAFYAKRYFPRPFFIETQRGVRKVFANEQGAKVEMGEIITKPPATLKNAQHEYVTLYLYDTGVPHSLIEVVDLSLIDVEKQGHYFRHHSHFQPSGTNVSFIQRFGDSVARIRTYERGVEAETGACGTAAVATAAYFYSRSGVTNWKIIPTSEEALTVYITENRATLYAELEGPCTFFGTTRIELSKLEP